MLHKSWGRKEEISMLNFFFDTVTSDIHTQPLTCDSTFLHSFHQTLYQYITNQSLRNRPDSIVILLINPIDTGLITQLGIIHTQT